MMVGQEKEEGKKRSNHLEEQGSPRTAAQGEDQGVWARDFGKRLREEEEKKKEKKENGNEEKKEERKEREEKDREEKISEKVRNSLTCKDCWNRLAINGNITEKEGGGNVEEDGKDEEGVPNERKNTGG